MPVPSRGSAGVLCYAHKELYYGGYSDAKMRTRTDTIFGVIWGVMLRFAIIVGILYLLYRVRSILVAVLIAVMLAYVALPAVEYLMRFRIRKWGVKWQRFFATLLVFIVLAGWTAGAVRLLIFPFQDELSQLSANMSDYVEQMQKAFKKTVAWYGALPPDLRQFLSQQDVGRAGNVLAGWARKLVESTVNWVTYILDIILIPVLAFYFVLDSRTLKREFVAMIPRQRWREVLRLLRDTSEIFQTYVIAQIVLCLIAGLAVGIALWLFNMDYALVLAVLAGVTRAIPIIGPILGGIPIVLLATVKSTALGVKVLIFFIILHFVESKAILPNLMSARVRLHPAIIIVVLLIGGEFFGILGMFLAVPVAAVIREIARFYLIRPQLAAAKSGNIGEPSEPVTSSQRETNT